jgi:hypothetical protein
MRDAGKQLTPRAEQDCHRFSPGTGAKRTSPYGWQNIIMVVFYPERASNATSTRADP